jgi:hypothetical protein
MEVKEINDYVFFLSDVLIHLLSSGLRLYLTLSENRVIVC